MLDIKVIRANPETVKQGMKKRNKNMDHFIDEIIEIDAQRREISSQTDVLKNKQNIESKKIPQLKKEGLDTVAIFEDLKVLANEIKEYDVKISELEARQREILLNIPNIPNESVSEGQDETSNIEVRKWGEPGKFEFEPKPHWDLGAELKILDPETASKVTGSRFHFYRGLGARLERSLISLYLDTHTDNGYMEILPPFMANTASMTATGQLPKFVEDMYKIEGEDLYLIPTAEVPVTNMSRDDILDGKNLPQKYCAYSACFRGEVGAAGRDQKGIIRQHQFNKVELVKYTKPEDSYQELEDLTKDAERLLQLLELPYRVVALCGGDLSASSAKTYDIEVWMPSYNRYIEISSCSNFEDYQARRANIKYKDNVKDKAKFIHTLNGSGLAIGRSVAAIMENYQNEDGTITIPKALIPYMRTEIIK